ncbi:hypothetical protein D9611_013005 [Ephemerocybe angulata]|uniref:DUF6533 domain-containing protein n=1 Tax=Ephemerocybe angulata TaxID=980116 RepID=A0A8H5AUB7_9AGAR|nr:hypothetical protein D9611_013005 [Tulosesus angulatus]
MSEQESLQELATALQELRTIELSPQYVMLPGYVALIYYYITTFDAEVEHIWPQPTWKLGKLLFLLTRYSSVVVRILDIIILYVMQLAFLSIARWVSRCVIDALLDVNPSRPQLKSLIEDVPIAYHVKIWYQCFYIDQGVALTSVTAVFWVCLYALLGGKAKYLIFLALGFLAFTIPMQVLQGFFIGTWEAVPLPQEEYEIGYSCSYIRGIKYENLYTTGAYIAFARTTSVMIVAVYTVVVRYRAKNNNIIKIIRREGGMYYISAMLLHLFAGLSYFPGNPVFDKYNVVTAAKLLLIPIFADRLLLKMQNIDDPGTQAAISTLMFDHNEYRGQIDEEGTLETQNDEVSQGGDRDPDNAIQMVERSP